MKKLSVILLLIFFSISSLVAKDNQKKLSKEEVIKRFMQMKYKSKILDKEAKIARENLKKEQAATQALKKIRQALEKAQNSKE